MQEYYQQSKNTEKNCSHEQSLIPKHLRYLSKEKLDILAKLFTPRF